MRAATQSSSAAVNTGPAKWSPSIWMTARVRCLPLGQLGRRGGQLLAAPLGEVGHRGDDEVVLGREVVQLGAPADARALRDQRGRRTAEAVLDQQLDGRLQQPRPHRAGALLLRHAGGRRRGHAFRMADHKQTVKPDCKCVERGHGETRECEGRPPLAPAGPASGHQVERLETYFPLRPRAVPRVVIAHDSRSTSP